MYSVRSHTHVAILGRIILNINKVTTGVRRLSEVLDRDVATVYYAWMTSDLKWYRKDAACPNVIKISKSVLQIM